jgi:hypothetical protein
MDGMLRPRSRHLHRVAALAASLVLAGCAARPTPSNPAATPVASAAAPAGSPGQVAGVGRVQPVATMSVPRAVATATRLPDGRILVAGGCTDAGCDLGSPGGATAEMFDPAAGSFAPTGDLSVWRDDHSAIALPDGRVMLIGGWSTAGLLDSTDVFDPARGTFAPGPTMHSPRAGDTPVPLLDDRILIAGGFLGNRPTTAMAEIYDPSAGTMSPTGSMVEPRGAYAAARLADGRVLFAGGLDNGVVVATAEIFDPASGSFVATGSMSVARYKGGAVPLPDGRVLVFGGSGDIDGSILYATSELFDPASGTFSTGPSMGHARYKVAESTVRLGSGDYLVSSGAPEPEVLRMSPLGFAPVSGSLGATRLFLAAAPIDDRRVLLVGGYDRAIRPTNQAWLFEAGG